MHVSVISMFLLYHAVICNIYQSATLNIRRNDKCFHGDCVMCMNTVTGLLFVDKISMKTFEVEEGVRFRK